MDVEDRQKLEKIVAAAAAQMLPVTVMYVNTSAARAATEYEECVLRCASNGMLNPSDIDHQAHVISFGRRISLLESVELIERCYNKMGMTPYEIAKKAYEEKYVPILNSNTAHVPVAWDDLTMLQQAAFVGVCEEAIRLAPMDDSNLKPPTLDDIPF